METDIAFTTDFWTSPVGENFRRMSVHWITQDWGLKGLAFEDAHLGDDKFPQRPYHCKHIREAHGFVFGVWSVSQEF